MRPAAQPLSALCSSHDSLCKTHVCRLDRELKAFEEEKQLCILPQDPEAPEGQPPAAVAGAVA